MKEQQYVRTEILRSRENHAKIMRSVFTADEAFLGIIMSMYYIRSIPDEEDKNQKENSINLAMDFASKFLTALSDKQRDGVIKMVKDNFKITLNINIEEEPYSTCEQNKSVH